MRLSFESIAELKEFCKETGISGSPRGVLPAPEKPVKATPKKKATAKLAPKTFTKEIKFNVEEVSSLDLPWDDLKTDLIKYCRTNRDKVPRIKAVLDELKIPKLSEVVAGPDIQKFYEAVDDPAAVLLFCRTAGENFTLATKHAVQRTGCKRVSELPQNLVQKFWQAVHEYNADNADITDTDTMEGYDAQ